MKKMNWFGCFDRWLCIHIPLYCLRIRWQELWIRKDEFHVSFNLDAEAIIAMERRGVKSTHDVFFGFGLVTEKTARYLSRLSERRETAHRRTL